MKCLNLSLDLKEQCAKRMLLFVVIIAVLTLSGVTDAGFGQNLANILPADLSNIKGAQIINIFN